ncbi:hypothetical protein F2P79_008243 [Pimephales promelas]|nr:hypothetical protein F2P79_008243 [Pimephales promelas]
MNEGLTGLEQHEGNFCLKTKTYFDQLLNLTGTAGSRKTPAPFLPNEDFSAVVYIPSTTCMLLMGGGHSGIWHLSWSSYKEILNEG